MNQARWLGKAMTLEAMEKLLITDALRRPGGNRRRAARELGTNPSTLFRKLKALKLPESAPAPVREARLGRSA